MFIRPKKVIFEALENFLLSPKIKVCEVTQKSCMPTPIEPYLLYKVYIDKNKNSTN